MKRVLSVGQCLADQTTLDRYFREHFTAEVVATSLPDESLAELHRGGYDLVLINRKLDADHSDGLEILAAIKADPQLSKLPVMLVTNYPEYQQQAIAAGAEPGFGKQEYDQPETLDKLRRFLD